MFFLFIYFSVFLFIFVHVLDLEYNFVRKGRASKCQVPSIRGVRSAKPMESTRNSIMAQEQPRPGRDVREAGALAGQVLRKRCCCFFQNVAFVGPGFNLGLSLFSPLVVSPGSCFHAYWGGQA